MNPGMLTRREREEKTVTKQVWETSAVWISWGAGGLLPSRGRFPVFLTLSLRSSGVL